MFTLPLAKLDMTGARLGSNENKSHLDHDPLNLG